VPSLRERRVDIRALVDHFLSKHASQLDNNITLTEDAYRRLEACSWPGNVRQLESAVESALALSANSELGADDFALGDGPACTSLDEELEQERRRRIEDMLKQCNGNQVEAARRLGMPRRTLVELLRRYGANRKRKSAPESEPDPDPG
jgi:DNA-binding NtrC family response regulator